MSGARPVDKRILRAVAIVTQPRQPMSTRLHAAILWGSTLLAVATMFVAARWFVVQWRDVGVAGAGLALRPGWILAAALLLTMNAVAALALWRKVLAAAGVVLGWRAATDTFAPSLLTRYIPGRIWANAARMAVARRMGVGIVRSGSAVVWETLLAMTAALLVAWIGLGQRLPPAFKGVVPGLLACAALAWILAAVNDRLPRGIAAAWMVSLAGWAAYSAAHVALALAITDVSIDQIGLLTGSLALAWAVGYLAIFVPLGFGIRDILLVQLLAPLFAPLEALAFVTIARLVQLGVDALLTVGWLGWRLSSR